MSTTTTAGTYTLCEVAQNNGKCGRPLWLIYKNGVYDVTKFAQVHPGGLDLICEYGGKDATKAFHDVGHSSDALRQLRATKLGVLDTNCLAAVNAQCESAKRKKKRFKFFHLFC